MMNNLPCVRGTYKFAYNLAHLTWFKVGGNADVFFKPTDSQDLAFFLEQNQGTRPVNVIGAGSNLIIRDGGIDGVVVKLGQTFTQIAFLADDIIVVGSACLNNNLAHFCKENGLAGLEFLVGIPGTIGGGVAMNAGAYGREFKDIVVWIEALNFRGELQNIKPDEIKFKYRGNDLPKDLIITKVAIKVNFADVTSIAAKMQEINEKRAYSQPIKLATGGSTFANPISGSVSGPSLKAWQLIDQAGMRGKQVGGAQISELHCNFMINLGSASAKDLETLGDLAQKKVFEYSGYRLEWEIKRIGHS